MTPAQRAAAGVAVLTGLPVRTGPGHPRWPHEDQRIPRSGWNVAERVAAAIHRITEVTR